jgi:hypothetical protein
MEKGKGLAALLISKAKPMEREDEEEGGNEGMYMAVEDMMRALDEKDPDMFKAALNAFLDCR